MRSLWFRCSRASSSCLSGAEVSRGMLGEGDMATSARATSGRGRGQGWVTYMGTRVLFFS